MLPLHFGKSRFHDLRPSHVNNSKIVLKDVSDELGQSPTDLWLDAVDESFNSWSDDRFYHECADLDWLIITGLCEFRHIGEKFKEKNPKLKIAVLAYDLGPIIRPELTAEGMEQWFRESYLESVRLYADHVFTISRHTAIDCARHFAGWSGFKAPVWSTPLPAEPPSLSEFSLVEAQSFLERHQLSQQKYFVAIGTIEPRKNLAIAILGFNRFCQMDPNGTADYRFVIIGKQGWRNEDTKILSMIGENAHRFIFPGYLPRKEVERAILLSAGLVMPSRLEGFGLPIALAKAYGVPTITCNNTSLPEASKVTSLFVTTDNPDRMALALWQLASLRQRTLPTADQLLAHQVRNSMAWDEYLKQWIDCLLAADEADTKMAKLNCGGESTVGAQNEPIA
jgi:glycosyltransferase involved in cell wall biosynthesis